MNDIFLSYRRDDAADVTGRINDRLCEHFGGEAIFTDVSKIPLGVDLRGYLDDRVSRSKVLLPVIGKSWLVAKDEEGRRRLEDPDDFVRIEIELALERDIAIIPLLVQGIKMPAADQLPESIRPLAFRTAKQIRPDPDFDVDIERLVDALKQHVCGSRSTGAERAAALPAAKKGALAGSAPMLRSIVTVLTLILIASELLTLTVFMASEADSLRRAAVLLTHLPALGLLILGAVRRLSMVMLLGAIALVGPWLLVFLLGPVPTMLVTGAAVAILGALVLKAYRARASRIESV